jgi:uncharacterized protein YbjT (DUF2867 family)
MILVTGATGRAGSQVVRALLEQTHEVRAFVRDPASARDLLGGDAELAVGDFADHASVRAALNGVSDVFLSGPDDPRRVEWEKAVIDAAAAAGVRRIVKLSSIVARRGAPVAFWDWHGRIESHLRQSAIPAVVLRSSFFMSNLLQAAEPVALTGRLYAPAAGAKIAMIDPRDVGAAAAAVLTTAGHEGRTYVLSGPEAITYGQVAAVLSAATARSVEFVALSDEEATDALIQAGLPAFGAEQVVAIFAQARSGAAEQVTATVESLTGAPPRDVAGFVRDYAGAFQTREEAA